MTVRSGIRPCGVGLALTNTISGRQGAPIPVQEDEAQPAGEG